MVAINKQDLINYLKKTPENLNFNIFGTMLDDFRNTYETDEQIVDKIKNIIINIIEDGSSISPEDDTITELVDLITELLPEKMIIKPEGTLEITENGEYDVINKAGVNVNVIGVVNPALVLWDWEGTKLAEYSVEDALALTELPAPNILPAYAAADHELLLFQKWNWSLANIKTWIQNHEGETLDIGAIYTTTDGQDHNFWGNPRLDTATTITMQKCGTTSIGNGAFDSCYSLTQINIPDGVTSIGSNAFYSCYSLTQINIPDGVTSIEDDAFYSCYSLCDVLLESKPTLSNTNAFGNLPTNYRIYVPRTNLSWFETATNWSTIYSHIVAIEDYIEYLESIGFNVDDYKEVTP